MTFQELLPVVVVGVAFGLVLILAVALSGRAPEPAEEEYTAQSPWRTYRCLGCGYAGYHDSSKFPTGMWCGSCDFKMVEE